MLDFFASPQLEYQSVEVDRMNRELLERLALQNQARGAARMVDAAFSNGKVGGCRCGQGW